MLERHPQVVIATDDMYEHIWWGPEPFTGFVTANPVSYDRTVTINGCSKSYAMTGWRIGYCGGPAEVIAAMGTIQGPEHLERIVNLAEGSTAALDASQDCVAEMNRAFKSRHDLVVAGLECPARREVHPGLGNVLCICECRTGNEKCGHRGRQRLRRVPDQRRGCRGRSGSAFGAPGHIRLSFAAATETLKDALGRMQRALAGGKARLRA